MVPFSRPAAPDGRARPRTGTGPSYQVPARTAPAASAAVSRYPVAVPQRLRLGFLLLAVALSVAGVAGCAAAAPSFDPTGACTTDGKVPGAYPALEARVPTAYRGAAPQTLDSGRNCTPAGLGALAAAGFTEVRFAGATWTFGAERAAALAVFTAKGLTADLVADFYTQSAQAAARTHVDGVSHPTVAGRPGHRLDTTTSTRTQTVLVWPAADRDFVNVVITNDLPDARIDDAVAAFGGR
jgi:hypothetical protein